MIKSFKKSTKPLIYASNLHVGGGVQVASSFVNDCISGSFDCDMRVSTAVMSQLTTKLIDFNNNISVYNSFGLSSLFDFNVSILNYRYHTIFAVFGPFYSLTKPKLLISGFAQPWIVYPNNEVYRRLSVSSRLKIRIRNFVQIIFFSRADILVVESENVKNMLSKRYFFKDKVISVVPNRLSSVFCNESSWRKLDYIPTPGEYRIGYLGRAYLHKNLSILPAIAKVLRDSYNLKVKFCVTLTDSEWDSLGYEFRQASVNYGPLKIYECPSFYEQVDACIFPSLLECFSIMPIESMFMEKPIFASDRDFVRASCGEYPFYFDPNSPCDAALKIFEYFQNMDSYSARISGAKNFVQNNYFDPMDRSTSYFDLIGS